MERDSCVNYRIDKQVYFVMAAVCILASGLIGLRCAAYKPCAAVKINCNTSLLQAGNIIRFNAVTSYPQKMKWNFGDGMVVEETAASVNHLYKKAGRYIVTLVSDCGCAALQTVLVGEAAMLANNSLQGIIQAQDTAFVNEPVKFTGIYSGAFQWEWHFGETVSPNAFTQEATYVYSNSGLKKVYLRLNGRTDLTTYRYIFIADRRKTEKSFQQQHPKTKSTRKKIIVLSIPTAPTTTNLATQLAAPLQETPKPAAPDISHEQMEILLLEVASGNKKAADFSAYMCERLTIPVAYDGRVTSFDELCKELYVLKAKKIRKLAVIITRNAGSNCIVAMSVTIRKKSFLGL